MAELTISHLTEAVQIEGIKSEKRDEKQISELASLNKSFAQYFKSMANQAGDNLEKEREKKKEKSGGDQPRFGQMVGDAKGMGFLGVIGAIGAALTGLVVGFLDGIKDSFKLITPKFIKTAFSNRVIKPITMLFDALGDIFRKAGTGQILKGDTFKVFGRFTTTLESIAKRFKGVIASVRSGSTKFFEFFGKIGDFFKSIGRNIKAFFLSSDVIRNQLKNFSKLGETFKTITKGASEGGSIFARLGEVVKPFFNVFKRIGKFLGGPITVAIISIIDGFIGSFKAFTDTEGGIFAKISAAISGFFAGITSGFIGGLLDLGKMVIGFVAGLFGFDSFKEKLAEFSFQDMIFDGLMFPFRAVMSLFDGKDGNMFSTLASDLIEGIKSIFSGITGFVKQKFKAIGSSIAGFFGFGGDEEPEVKEIKEGKVVPKVEKQVVTPPQDDDFHEVRGTDEDGFNYTETKRAPKSEQDMMAAEEERYKRHLKLNQDRMVKYNEQGKGGSKGAMYTEERIMKLQAKLDELQAKQSAGNTVIAPSTTTNTTNSSSQAVYGDASPATDDLDRVA